MLQDPRARALAIEFGGNWLDFRRFEEHNAVDRERFPSFNNELRQAMFEEPVRFLLDVVQNEPLGARLPLRATTRSSTRCWPSTTACRRPAARAERLGAGRRCRPLRPRRPAADGGVPDQERARAAHQPGEARLLGGEATCSASASRRRRRWCPSCRTTRRSWTCRCARCWRGIASDPSCAGCHARFDSLGLVFEGYGPVGERRDQGPRRAGRSTPRATFPGGSEGAGLEGLRAVHPRAPAGRFRRQPCRKLLAYALGRSLMLSDEPADPGDAAASSPPTATASTA